MTEPQRVSIVARASEADPTWLESLAVSSSAGVEIIALVDVGSGVVASSASVGVESGRFVRVPVASAGAGADAVAAIENGIALAQGEWLLLLGPGDRLTPDALDRLRAQARRDVPAVLAGVASVEHALAALVKDPRALAGSLVRAELVSRIGGLDPSAGDAWELDLWLRLLPSLAGAVVTDATLATRGSCAREATRECAVVLARALLETLPTAWPLCASADAASESGDEAALPSSVEAEHQGESAVGEAGARAPDAASTLLRQAGSGAGADVPAGRSAHDGAELRTGSPSGSRRDEAAACRELARLAASTGAPELTGVAAMLWLRGGAAAPPETILALAAALPGLAGATTVSRPRAAHGADVSRTDELRVVLEVRSLDRGGLESVVADLAIGLRREGIVPAVVCTERGGTEVERVRAAGVEVVVLDGGDRASELAAWLDAHDVDLLNPHYSDLGTPLAAARGIPVVVTLHNEYAWVPNRKGDPFRVLDPSVDLYVAVSESAAEFCAARFGIARERIRVIRNALSRAASRRSSLDRFAARAELDIPAEAELLLQVGRVDAVKAPLALVEAVAVLAAERPRLCAWIVGPLADRDYAARLRARIDELGLADRILVAGRRGDVPRLLAAADVFVLPSVIEGLSLAVVEALAAGVPAVLSRTGDAAFLLGEGSGGADSAVLPGALVERPRIDPARTTPESFHDLVWKLDPSRGAPLAGALAAILDDLPARRDAARRRAAELAPLLAADRMLHDYATLFRGVARELAPHGRDAVERSIAFARSRHDEARRGTAALRAAVRDLLAAEAAFVRERSRADANAAAVGELSRVVEQASAVLAPAGDAIERAIGKLRLMDRLRSVFRAATGRSEGDRP